MSVCPVCDGKPRIVIVDETEDADEKTFNSSEPENCPSCGTLRNTVTIQIVNKVTPLPGEL